MEITPAMEEVLEAIYMAIEDEPEKERSGVALKEFHPPLDEAAFKELQEGGCITFTEAGRFRLTPSGMEQGRGVLRRHRLAERLLMDVLDVRGELMDETACQFEHLLHRDVAEKICSLLGHPKVCPHGKPIPPGSCCEAMKGPVEPAVATLADLEPGQEGIIAYLHADEPQKIQKLMSLGVLPGSKVELIRRFPSYVFRVGYSQYAVDGDIAAAVYVRLTS
jgi:DtxR family Mn-dependent transcriptional regulator